MVQTSFKIVADTVPAILVVLGFFLLFSGPSLGIWGPPSGFILMVVGVLAYLGGRRR